MLMVLVIADDMTGANDTGALLNKAGFDTVSSPTDQIETELYSTRDVLCVNIDSRAIHSEVASKLVRNAVNRYAEDETLISKRIDSTLRGNVGSEIDGVLEALPTGYKAIVVASSPQAGRICIGGYILVHSVPLELCGLGNDLKTPVHSSKVIDIIKEQSNRSILMISLDEVLKGSQNVSKLLKESKESVIVIDAVTEDNIDIIAKASVESGISFVCIDPGAYTLKVARYKFSKQRINQKKKLFIIGSLSTVTKRQLDYFNEKNKTLIFKIDVLNLLENHEEEEKNACDFFEKHKEESNYFCITTAYSKQLSSNMNGDQILKEIEKISIYITQIGEVLLQRHKIDLVYLCGGDIAKDFIISIGAKAIDVIDEIIPLAVYGKILGGEYQGLQILTKGGMIGNDESLNYMITHLSKLDYMKSL